MVGMIEEVIRILNGFENLQIEHHYREVNALVDKNYKICNDYA